MNLGETWGCPLTFACGEPLYEQLSTPFFSGRSVCGEIFGSRASFVVSQFVSDSPQEFLGSQALHTKRGQWASNSTSAFKGPFLVAKRYQERSETNIKCAKKLAAPLTPPFAAAKRGGTK